MCLYPKLIRNPKYLPNKKNGGVIPAVTDNRVKLVPIGCGNCIECRKQKARYWQVRLLEDIKTNKNGKFITLTFSNESITKLCQLEHTKLLKGYALDNAIATTAVRLFLERWRKKYKKSLRHWLVTELGHNGTENIHLHGIVWTDENLTQLEKIWDYGFVWKGYGPKQINYVSSITVSYIIKYVTKVDLDHKNYKSIILTSPGIGANYMKRWDITRHKFIPGKTIETYRTSTGHEIGLPIYWKNKIFTEEEREKLWIEKLDKNERYVCGERVEADNTDEYYKLLKWHRERNKRLGYGTNEIDWDQITYEEERRKLMYFKRTNIK